MQAQIVLNLHPYLTVLIFSYSDLLQVLNTLFSFWPQNYFSFFYAWLLFFNTIPWWVLTYPLRPNLNAILSENHFLIKPHNIQYNILFVLFLELNIPAIPMNRLSWECLSSCLSFLWTIGSVRVCLVHQYISEVQQIAGI